MSVEVTVLMPCLNEAETLGACIDAAKQSFAELGVSGEVVVADNGSTDGSREIAAEHGARVVDVPERGYGSALLAGIEAAEGEHVIMGDADLSYDFSRLGAFVDELRRGSELVMGNRYAGGIHRDAMPWLHRRVGTPVLTAIARLFFGVPIRDVNCGLRGFRRDAIRALDLRSTGMEFASEMIVKSTLYDLRITEVPTTLSPDGRTRPPHLRTWRDGWRHLRFYLLYSPSWLFLYPGVTLAVLGVAATLWLLPGQREVAGVAFDVHTLLYAALATILGFQAMLFWACARAFAITEGLLPMTERFGSIFRYAKLESGLVVGVLVALAGVAGSIYAVTTWQDESFGRLDYQDTMRIVIPSGALLVIGVETILFSFFLSILGLRRR